MLCSSRAPNAGMRPLGLIFKNQSSFCSILERLMAWILYGICNSSSNMLAFQPFGVPEVYRVMPLSVAMVVYNGVKDQSAEARIVWVDSVDI